ALDISNHWQALAREAYRDDLDWQQRALTIAVLQTDSPPGITLEERLVQWRSCYQALLNRWDAMISELKSGNAQEFAMYAVALRELLDLAQSSSHACLDSD
ncbi:MAG: NAD-glutamate dehydrogenase, partial [Gammaproteobacteria bacterium]|nr:NAD-glutamate dehydrogenase [Gammaproteobacteria bacterium]